MAELLLFVDAFWISPYAMSAWVALTEKRVRFEVREVALHRKEQQAPGFPSPTGRIPALRHGELWLAESSAIAEYVDELFPAPAHPRLLPADRRERAVCRELMAWLRSDLGPLREERPTTTLWYERASKPLSESARAAAARLVRAVEPLVLEGRANLFDEWCLADTDLALMLQRLQVNGDPLPPKLAAYARSQWLRPSVAAWTAHARVPYVAY